MGEEELCDVQLVARKSGFVSAHEFGLSDRRARLRGGEVGWARSEGERAHPRGDRGARHRDTLVTGANERGDFGVQAGELLRIKPGGMRPG